MSNKLVSSTYRTIIDDVINNVRQDFEDMGIEKEVLEELQRSWESKILHSQVAHFEGAPPMPPKPSRRAKREQEEKEQAAAQEAAAAAKAAAGEAAGEDAEDGDGERKSKMQKLENGAAAPSALPKSEPSGSTENGGEANGSSSTAAGKRKRETDPPSSSVPPADEDEDALGSDLDDPDEDDDPEGAGGDGADGEQDMVLCLYDKVQRVRNKWKCVLKDGIASIDGKDYLFQKCTGEFEW